jgi:hypothetical protein
MSKLSRVLGFLATLGLVVAVMVLLASRSGSRGALQRYRAELQRKGEKLTYAELMKGQRPNAVDSHALITNAIPKLSNARFNPGLLPLRTYLSAGQATVTWRELNLGSLALGGAGSIGTWEEFDAQMRAAESTLQEIRAALKNPALDAGPCTNMLVGKRVNFVSIRVAAQWLAGAAENDLHQGRLEAALQNLEALAGLARMERDEPTLVAQMIRVAVTGLGLSATWEALQAPGWTEAQLERLQRGWEPVDLVAAVETGLAGDRAGGYEIFATLRRHSGAQNGRLFNSIWNRGSTSAQARLEDAARDYAFLPAYKLTSIDQDELFYLQTMQEFIAGLRLLKAQQPWAAAQAQANRAATNLYAVASSHLPWRYFVSLTSIANYTRAGERAVQNETERQMTLAAIALKRCQLRHGKLPSSLEALVPEFLAAVPYDYMSARPLCYRLKEDGGYVLYSVGLDGKDDGGDPTPTPGGTPSLWGGRDAVWPSPAAEPGEPPPQPRR